MRIMLGRFHDVRPNLPMAYVVVLSTAQRGKALRVYGRCRRALSLELEVEPDAKIQARTRA